MPNKITNEEYINRVSIINPNIEVLEKYIDNKTNILHKCKIDGYEWTTKPAHILEGHGCPICGKTKIKERLKKNHEKYIEDLSKVNSNIDVLDEYVNSNTNIRHKCKICGYEWSARPGNILAGKGCPVCSGNKIGKPPEYRNSIWASQYREYFSKYLTEEQMKKYSPNSNQKIIIKCPDCGKEKCITINNLLHQGLSCICGDGRLYPNKFIYEFLQQVGVEYIPEYSPEWANNKIYDIYIPSLNCIIENHGMQHYDGCFERCGGLSLSEEEENDKLKQSIALKNGIKNYVILDCRKSKLEWIKNSIANSILFDLFNVDEKDIDWNQCDKAFKQNLIKTSSDLWNDGLKIKDISIKLNKSRHTISSYLCKAKNFGWCEYPKRRNR